MTDSTLRTADWELVDEGWGRRAGLRMYGPSAKVQNDQWQMPAMKKAD
jgi:hypothetical protein